MEKQNYISEGAVKLLSSKVDPKQEQAVFYNPVQVFNRDLSLLVTYVYTKQLQEEKKDKFNGIRFYDALSASG